MILTDIYVPALNETYDFQLDETVPVYMIIDEIVEVLQKKSGGTSDDYDAVYVLCSPDRGEILDRSLTLQECGVKNGSRLFIV